MTIRDTSERTEPGVIHRHYRLAAGVAVTVPDDQNTGLE